MEPHVAVPRRIVVRVWNGRVNPAIDGDAVVPVEVADLLEPDVGACPNSRAIRLPPVLSEDLIGLTPPTEAQHAEGTAAGVPSRRRALLAAMRHPRPPPR